MAKAKAIAKGATELVKYISEFGKTATIGKYGSGKNGIGQLSDEQLERGVNKFKAKKEEKKEKAKPKPKAKAKPKSPKRDVTKVATQKGLRFKDKPDVDIEVESDASRSVDETNLIRGARSAGRSTNQPGRTNIGRMSMANFIKDASKNYGVVQKRKKIDAEFQRRINLAETPAQKKKLKDALEKLQDQRGDIDEAHLAGVGRQISKSTRGKKKPKRSDYVDQDGQIIGNPTENQVKAAMRNAEARGALKEKRVLAKYLKELQDKTAGRGQLESAGKRMINTDDRMIQDAKKTLVAVFGKTKGNKIFKDKLSGAKTKSEFLVEIRSMVNKGRAEGQKGSHRSGETGAVVGRRKSRLKLADRSETTQEGRREVGSRRAKTGDVEKDAPMNKGGMAKKKVPVITIGIGMAKMPKGKKPRKGNMDLRNGGMVTSTSNNLKPVPSGNKGKGLRNLPTPVRNKMGFMKKGGMVKK